MEELKFPEGFKWGSATSAHQVEGDNHNDWSEWEKFRPPEFQSGKACDSFNRYEEDFDIAKNLNQNTHRFSIEWSRIEPKEGRFDHEAMHHYVNVVKALQARGIEPMITLWHFTNPVWFAEKEGFLNIDSPKIFTRYVKYVVDNLKDRVGLWITFNEATSVYTGYSYLNGQWPPQKRNIFKMLKVRNNIIKSHILAYQEIKKAYSVPRESSDLSNSMSHNIEPLVGGVENNLHIMGHPMLNGAIKLLNKFINLYFWDKTLPYQDFIGLNYYTTVRLPGTLEPRTGFSREMGWDIYPKGIYNRLVELKKYKKPIYITENGIADSADEKRGKFIKDHLRWVWQAIHEGADVRGYLYWSLLDNFEWARGFKPRFGLVEVDYMTFARKIRPSALEYAKICKMNQLETDS